MRSEIDGGLSDVLNLTFAKWSTYWLDEICPPRVKETASEGYWAYVGCYLESAAIMADLTGARKLARWLTALLGGLRAEERSDVIGRTWISKRARSACVRHRSSSTA